MMKLTRRRFFFLSSALATGCTSEVVSQATLAEAPAPAPGKEESADVLIIGASTGGVAAAIGACRGGAKKVVMTEETGWIGGQLTSQLVPPDENQWIETGGAPLSYRDFRKAIRQHYRTDKTRPMKPAYLSRDNLNPGNGWVSRLCHEPKVAVNVLERMLQPYLASGQLVIHRHTRPISAEVNQDRVGSVTVKDTRSGKDSILTGKYIIDATDQGDLLPLTRTEFVTGTEAAKDTGEPHAADIYRPGNIQSFTWCFILEHRDGEKHVIAKPEGYESWKSRFDWDNYSFYPKGDRDPQRKEMNFWTYRRVVDSRMFSNCPGDVSVINWHHNDYDLGSIHVGKDQDIAKHLDRSRELSLALTYWLQTACPRSDGKLGWPGLRLCPEQTGTPDGMAMAPYIRESRRIKAQFTVLEQHVSRQVRIKEFGEKNARAEIYKDSVGIGHYLYIDIHKTCEGYSNGGGSKVFPFQIPLGALLPVRVRNLIAGCKNLGVTHLTNGCFRLHPIEWNIGESAGALAAFCLAKSLEPSQVRDRPASLSEFQKHLSDHGVLLEWPAEAIHGGG